MIIYCLAESGFVVMRVALFLCLFWLFCLPALAQSFVKFDSVDAVASTQYQNPSALRKFFIGENYRKEWSTPVAMPVFDAQKMRLKVEKLGGGMQTKSLQLEDVNGREWALRTVDKNAKGGLPEKMQSNKFIVSVVQDLISASHPYGALITDGLANALGVPSTQPRLFYVSQNSHLGKYDSVFAGKVCLLELREVKKNDSGTTELLADMQKNSSVQVDQIAVLKARLLDMLVADWDRHPDQYKWYKEGKIYSIFPKDRDQAFFKSTGALPKALTLFVMKWIKGFNDDLSNIKNLNYKTQLFDAKFMNALDRKQWEQTIQQVQAALPDNVIQQAVLQLPPEFYAIRGKEIARKLIGRRNDLMHAGLKYYNYINTVVRLDGTNEDDRFELSEREGKINVRISNKQTAKVWYDRSFDSKDTKIIELHGFNGNDIFHVQPNVSRGIKLKFFGESGTDIYELNGNAKKYVFDSGENQIVQAQKTKLKIKMAGN
jgi:hypothetical protein